MGSQRVLFLEHPKGILIREVDSLGADFDAYRGACEGANFDWDETAWIVNSAEKALRIHERLVDTGFEPIMRPRVFEVLEREQEALRRSILDARVRLDRFEEVAKKSGRSLFPFQRRDALWMASRRRLINCNEQGTGKTIETLCSIPDPDDAAVIIACPAIAKGVWKRECERWRPDLKPVVLSGRGAFRYPNLGEMVIINYDILTEPNKLAKPSKAIGDKLVLVGDEGHFLKNKKSKRSRAFRALVEHAARAMLLTGTPLPNRPEELWNLLELLDIAREAYGSKKRFVKCFNGYELWEDCGSCEVCVENDGKEFAEGEEKPRCRKRFWRGYRWGLPETESGMRLERVLVRHLRSEVLPELPGKTTRIVTIECEKSKHQLDNYLDKVPNLLSIKSIDEVPFDKLSAARALLCRLKLEAIEELVETHEESNDPIVVFSAHRHVVDELAKRPGWRAIVGGVTDRNQIEDDFQAGKIRGIAATIQAASTAITLTRASHVYFVDASYVPADNAQAEDRVCRIGQTRGVVVTYLVLDHPIDQHVFKLLAKKQGIIEGSVELARSDKLLSEDDALTLLPKLQKPIVLGKPGARTALNQDERRAADLALEIADLAERRKGIEKGLLRVKVADKRVMVSMGLDLLMTDKLPNAQWSMAKIYAKKYGPILERAVEEAARAEQEEMDHGRL